jgi:tRNA A-37 threonylcarbamoyl transferase component Bud32
MSDLTGKLIAGRYRVIEFIGRGGMAEVYKVWDSRRNTALAMKLLHADLALDRAFLRRFHREAETLSRLQHPNIVRFYGLEQEGEQSFMLMDFIEGNSLKQVIFNANGPLPIQQTLDIMRQLCQALQFAHYEGFVHADVKPSNVLIDRAGRVMLNDFGIARMAQSTTATMGGAGTPAYMSPEQARGEKPTPQSDIYSAGVLLYEMLTGERPFSGDRSEAHGTADDRVRWEQINLEPPPPRELNPHVGTAIEAVALRALAKDPGRRYSGALELAEALAGAADTRTGDALQVGAPAVPGEPLRPGHAGAAATTRRAAGWPIPRAALAGIAILGLMIAFLANRPQLFGGVPAAPAETATGAAATIPGQAAATMTFVPVGTLTATVTALPSATSTPGVPMVRARDLGVNCRYGPGVEWEGVSALATGSQVEIIGKDKEFNYNWWQVDDPLNPGEVCWVALSVTDASGNLTVVPLVEAPPAEVTDISVSAEPTFTACGQENPVSFTGRIAMNGPAEVSYQWEITGGVDRTVGPLMLVFDTFGQKSFLFPETYAADCGSYLVTLRVLEPAEATAQQELRLPP